MTGTSARLARAAERACRRPKASSDEVEDEVLLRSISERKHSRSRNDFV